MAGDARRRLGCIKEMSRGRGYAMDDKVAQLILDELFSSLEVLDADRGCPAIPEGKSGLQR